MMMTMMISNKEVCAVITVFNPKKGFIPAILSRLRDEGVTRVIMIKNRDIKLDKKEHPNVDIHYCDRNIGSAGGYKLGIELALKDNHEFIWLLDEDNLPLPGALKEIIAAQHEMRTKVPSNQLMLLSYRPELFKHIYVHQKEGIYSIAPKTNSYLGFHFSQFLAMLKNRWLNAPPASLHMIKEMSVRLDSGYFGGLFFHKSVVKANSMPNTELFLYWDDMDFTNKFYLNGGHIQLVLKSVVEDMDAEEKASTKKGLLHHPFIDLEPRYKAFYYIRNLMFYEKRWSKYHSPVYFFNRTLMLSIVYLMALSRGRMDRITLLKKAVKSGQRMKSSND